MLQGHNEIRTEPGVFQHISTNGSHLQGTVTESGQGFPHLLQEPTAPNLHQSLPENQPQLAQPGTPATWISLTAHRFPSCFSREMELFPRQNDPHLICRHLICRELVHCLECKIKTCQMITGQKVHLFLSADCLKIQAVGKGAKYWH